MVHWHPHESRHGYASVEIGRAIVDVAHVGEVCTRYELRVAPAHPSPSGLSPLRSRSSVSSTCAFHALLQQQLRTHFAAAVDDPFRPGGELLDDLQPSAGRPTLVGSQRH
jgi:hypothetical protein